ncbi:MAG: hypothetical protein V4466_15940 [Pseudomonadota bacterium]
MRVTRRLILASTAALAPGLARGAVHDAHSLRLTHDGGRSTDYRVLAPGRSGPLGVVLFSHGAASANTLYDRILQPWAAAGFMVIAPNHVDAAGSTAPKVAAAELWRTRVQDLTAPLLQRAPFEAFATGLGAKLDWRKTCAAGHSFGAAVAQSLAGARMEGIAAGSVAHAGVASVLCLSPPGPRPNFVSANTWAPVTIPALLQTGDADILPGFIDDWRAHKQGFEDQPGRARWLIVGSGVDHYFGGLICRLDDGPKATAQAPALAATTHITTDFLLAYGRGDRLALGRLGKAARARADSPVLSLTRV